MAKRCFVQIHLLVTLMSISPVAAIGSTEEVHEDHHEGKEEAGRRVKADLVKASGLTIKKIEGGRLTNLLSLLGTVHLHPEKSVHLHPKYAGTVRDVLRSAGDRVRAGETLARIDNNIGIQVYDLTTPIGGVILDRAIVPGSQVNEETEAFTVGDASEVLVELRAYARDLALIRKGQKVLIRDPLTQEVKSSDVSFRSPVLDEATRTAIVHAYYSNPTGSLRPGAFIVGFLPIGEREVQKRIPTEVFEEGENMGGKLWVRQGDFFEEQEVQLGTRDHEFVEVLSDLEVGTEFIFAKANDVLAKVQKSEKGK